MNHNFFDLIRGANKAGWIVLNCFQFGAGKCWRVNLQKHTKTGEVFTEFSDHEDPIEAMYGAVRNATARDKAQAAREPVSLAQAIALADIQVLKVLKPAQEKKLAKVLDKWYGALATTRGT